MSGMIMYPQSMRKKASEMLRELDSMDEKIEKFFKRYEDAQNPIEFSGMAWLSVKNYIEDVQKPYLTAYKAWQNEQRDSLSIYSNAAGKLPDVHKLNKDQMENSIRKYRRYIEIEENRKNPNEDRIMRYEELIAEFEEKIQQMEDFAVAISGIFSEANAMQKAIRGARKELNRVKISGTGITIDYTRLSASEEMQAVTTIANIYIIISGGVTKERIAELEGMGLYKSDISKVFAASRDGGEKDMIIHFIKGDYKKAFTTANKDNGLVDSTAAFITEYLYRLGKIKNTDEEIQKVINAILESEDGISVRRAANVALSLQVATDQLIETDHVNLKKTGRFMEDEEYNETVNRINKLKAITILYGSISGLMSNAINEEIIYRFDTAEISELNYDSNKGTYDYHMKYRGISRGDDPIGDRFLPYKELKFDNDISTYLTRVSADVASQINFNYFEKLENRRAKMDMELVEDIVYGAGASSVNGTVSTATTLSIGMKKAFSGSYAKLRNTTMDLLKDKSGIANKINIFTLQPVTLSKNLMITYEDYENNRKLLEESMKNIQESQKASLLYEGGGYRIGKDTKKHFVCYGPYSVDMAGALETWMYVEADVDGTGVRDLTLGDLIKDENIMSNAQIEAFTAKLDKDIKEAEGDPVAYKHRVELKKVWDGNIEGMSETEIVDYIIDINEDCSAFLNKAKGKKNIELDFRNTLSSYNHDRRYYE